MDERTNELTQVTIPVKPVGQKAKVLTFNMFCEGILLLYHLRVELQVNLFIYRLWHKIVKLIDIQNLPGCYLDYI